MGEQDRSLRWTLRAAPAVALIAGVAGIYGCDNGAVGVEACREIEVARCRAVVGCPTSPVETDEDVENCELHYRDQCLFGMADSINPDQPAVTGCVAAIEQARACWDSGQTLGDCSAELGVPELVAGIDPAVTGCDGIMFPQILAGCAFLSPPAEEEEEQEGTGGSGTGGGGG
ncbi:MAG: hypothetical protein JRI23_35535 [Deltaproteobacteria bacterium]|jgi:hypothetical protein|nr:hypothetical protein [Deltaproteobacteria bacterium]MBW2537643.1 hypothetical protein [Deltaproteobacteria bacterium]